MLPQIQRQPVIRGLGPHDLVNALAQIRHRRCLQPRPTVLLETKVHVGAQEGELLDHPRDLGQLGAGALEVLGTRRRVEEEIAYQQTRATWARGYSHVRLSTAVDHHSRAGPDARACKQLDARHRRDARQSLAAKAQRGDAVEIIDLRDLARGMLHEGHRGVARRHPVAVVNHFDQTAPAILQTYGDPERARIERVLHQLLDDGRRPFDHLAGGDAIDNATIQQAYRAAHTVDPIWRRGFAFSTPAGLRILPSLRS